MRERENQNFKMYLKIALAIVALIGFIVMINQIWKTDGFREWAMWRMVVAVIFGSLALWRENEYVHYCKHGRSGGNIPVGFLGCA